MNVGLVFILFLLVYFDVEFESNDVKEELNNFGGIGEIEVEIYIL